MKEEYRCYRCRVLQDFQGYCNSCKVEKKEEEMAEAGYRDPFWDSSE